MKLIEAKCPKCKELIKVDGDSDTTKCDYCGEKIEVKEALLEIMLGETKKATNKDTVKETVEESLEEQEEEQQQEIEETTDDLSVDDEDEDDEDDEEDEDDDDEEDQEDEEDEVELEEESTEDFDEENVVLEKPEPKKEEKVTKRITKEKRIEKDKLLLEAEKLLKANNYDESYKLYQSALEIDPSDTYCKYRVNYISFLKDYINKEKLEKLYESVFDVDYCLDEHMNKTNYISIIQNDFVNCMIATSYAVYFDIAFYSRQTFEHLKKYYSIWFSMLYVLEKFAKEDIDGEVKVKIYNCILVIIEYLNNKYEYRDGRQRKYRNEEHRDVLNKKREKYINKLEDINPSYAKSFLLNYNIVRDKIKVPHIKEPSESFNEPNVIVKAIDSIFSKYPKTTVALIVLLIYFIIKLIFS